MICPAHNIREMVEEGNRQYETLGKAVVEISETVKSHIGDISDLKADIDSLDAAIKKLDKDIGDLATVHEALAGRDSDFVPDEDPYDSEAEEEESDKSVDL